jgi:transcription initiation factor TFIIIB Brf1 subunit/transcription initiation factor TFIIB
MVTCRYCGSDDIVQTESEFVCRSCGTVLGVVAVQPRRQLSRKEILLARLYGYA